MRVLIVEHDPVLARLVHEQVLANGHLVCGAPAAAEEAVDLAARCNPDLVIMDAVGNRFATGTEAVKRMRNTAPMHVVFISTDDEIVKMVLRDLGPAAIITTPLDKGQIDDVLAQVSNLGPPQPA